MVQKLVLKNQFGEESINTVLAGSTALSGGAQSITNLTGTGAATITAASITGGIVDRTGATGDFTDTTDTAPHIIAAIPQVGMAAGLVGQTFKFQYMNDTAFAATLHAGANVTLTDTLVPAACVASFLVKVTDRQDVSFTLLSIVPKDTQQENKYSTGTTTGTFTAGQLTGAKNVVYASTAATPGTINTRTAPQMIADIPNSYIGQTWKTRIINTVAINTLTVGAGMGVTITGTATIATATWTDFLCTYTGAGTITMQNIGSGVSV